MLDNLVLTKCHKRSKHKRFKNNKSQPEPGQTSYIRVTDIALLSPYMPHKQSDLGFGNC